MLNYQKWKKLNETLGPTTLGLKTPHTLGIRGVQFSDLGNEESQDTTDECGCSEKMGDSHDMGDHEDVMHDDMDVDVDLKDDMGDEEDVEAHDSESEEDMDDYDMKDKEMHDEEDMEDESEEEDEDMEDEDMEDEDMEDEDMEDEDMEDEDMEDEDMEDEDMEDEGDEEPDQLVHKKELDMDHDMPEKTLNKKGNANMISETEWWKSVSSMIGTAAPNGKIIAEAAEVEEKEEKEDAKKGLPSGAKPAVTRFEKALPEEKLKNISKNKIKSILSELMSHILQYNTTMSKQNLKDLFRQVVSEYGAGKK